MGQIVRFIRPETAFDPEAVAILIAAYDRAILKLDDPGQPEIVRETIAKRIIAAASKGERDPEQLCEVALAALRIVTARHLPRREL